MRVEGSLSERRSAVGRPVQKMCAVSDGFEIKAIVTASDSTEVARASAGEPGNRSVEDQWGRSCVVIWR